MKQFFPMLSQTATCLFILAMPYLVGQLSDFQTEKIEGKIGKEYQKDDEEKFQEFGCNENFHRCDCFYCQCKPLLRGLISTQPFIVPASGTVTIPIISATGYGDGLKLNSFPLLNSAGTVIAEAGRIDITRCGWYRIGIYGEITITFPAIQAPIPQLAPIISLKSSFLSGDVTFSLKSIEPGRYFVSTTAFRHFTTIPECACSTIYYSLVISNLTPGSTVFFTPETNSRVLFQRMGPCEKCKKEKSCCCPKCTCQKENNSK